MSYEEYPDESQPDDSYYDSRAESYDEYHNIDDLDYDKKIKNEEIREKRAEFRAKKKELTEDKELMRDLRDGNIANGKKRLNDLLKREVWDYPKRPSFDEEVLQKMGYLRSNPRDPERIVKDENGHFKYVLFKPMKNQTPQHIYAKNRIADIDREHAILEYKIEGTKERIDVMFIYWSIKVGVEIQTSKVSKKTFLEKVNLLKNHCNYWFIVVYEKAMKKYDIESVCNIVNLKEAINRVKGIKEKYDARKREDNSQTEDETNNPLEIKDIIRIRKKREKIEKEKFSNFLKLLET